MMFGHSHPRQHAYIAFCREPLLDSRIRCSKDDGRQRVAVGSADRMVRIRDVETRSGKITYKVRPSAKGSSGHRLFISAYK